MTLQFFNTLSKKKEEFTPINTGKVGMYSCGPTVYQAASIGNFRSFIFSDLLRRVLEFNGYEVKQVMNITDVGHLVGDGDTGEDKMIKAMRQEGKSAWDVAEFYTELFIHDMELLNIKRPTVLPKATAHIDDQIELTKTLEEKGFTYTTSDGVYFDTSKLADYGKLSGQKLSEKEEGARVEKNPEKKNPTDFALWKFSPKDGKREMEWDSPWGIGFPGWAIECSAMSEKYLDSPFDIHTGGEDHIPVHHANEMAQTEAARGHELTHYWMHNAFLTVQGGKMSKSLGNTYTLEDLAEKGFEPLVFRYFLLGAQYRQPQNFTWEALGAAQNALHNLEDIVRAWDRPGEVNKEVINKFKTQVNDDLNLPAALAEVWNLVGNEELESSVKAATILELDDVLGLKLDDIVAKSLLLPQVVEKMLKDRELARIEKDFEESDRLREEIKASGYLVEDTAEGQKVREAR
ncbi:MAG: cysteine--tRNA ligase [Patescibacteria group bacterium]